MTQWQSGPAPSSKAAVASAEEGRGDPAAAAVAAAKAVDGLAANPAVQNAAQRLTERVLEEGLLPRRIGSRAVRLAAVGTLLAAASSLGPGPLDGAALAGASCLARAALQAAASLLAAASPLLADEAAAQADPGGPYDSGAAAMLGLLSPLGSRHANAWAAPLQVTGWGAVVES